MAEQITDGKVVGIAYRLRVDGQEIEEAPKDDPLEYLHGADNIIPGLEEVLAGKTVGEKVVVTLAPDDAYGEYDADAIETVDRADFPPDVEAGMELLLEDDAGNMFEVTVKEVHEDRVVLDMNSPLAGKTVTYEAEVLSIRDADADELDHGHPHSYEEDEDDYDE